MPNYLLKFLAVLAVLQLSYSMTYSKYVNDPSSLERFKLGKFVVSIDKDEPYFQITSEDDPDRVVFQTLASWPFLTTGFASESRAPIMDGNFKASEWVLYETPYQSIKSIEKSGDSIIIAGEVYGLYTKATYTFEFYIENTLHQQILFNVNLTPVQGIVNRLFLNYWCDPTESFHGFGLQYTHWNLKGRRVPILVAEQGVGRGLEPLTSTLNYLADGAGGDWSTSYAPKAHYITNKYRSVMIENTETMFFDLRDDDAVVVEIWGTNLRGRIIDGRSLLDQVEQATLVTGRMSTLPAWTQHGAVVGLEGGTKEVSELVERMREQEVPIAAVWLQDWVGLRHAFDGDRLVWNWVLDEGMYPNWNEMIDSWKHQGPSKDGQGVEDDIRVMTYINPFFSNPANFSSFLARDVFAEGVANRYFVQSASGAPYVLRSGSIEFHMVDLTNPAAYQWMKDIIKREMLDKTKASGWMADFGEYLPFDAVLYSGESGASQHNLYPQQWAQLNKEAVTEWAAETGTDANDIVYFMRSAWMESPGLTPLFWLGDQLVSWDNYDGIRSVLTSTLSGGLSGHSLTHSDIGGYTVEEVGPIHYTRTRELLLRWTELSAFGACMFRTHIGSTTSPTNAQVYDDEASMAHFSLFTRIFSHLADYRKVLMGEAEAKGYPVMRTMAMHFGEDPVAWSLTEQFLFGEEFLVAPVLDPVPVNKYSNKPSSNIAYVNVYIPAHSEWVHLWTGIELNGGENGRTITVPAPIGRPPVFYAKSSEWGLRLRSYLTEVENIPVEIYEGVSSTEGFPESVKESTWDWKRWLGISDYASSWKETSYSNTGIATSTSATVDIPVDISGASAAFFEAMSVVANSV